ncbi:MAG: DoxX family protein [Pleurocapsa sp. MO_226.B13]|nr:DoxX family protein [Pleurocapsa sp. MO_226.B13]
MFDTTNIEDKGDRVRLHTSDNYLLLLARIFLSAIFIWSGINKIINPVATQENMSAHGMPLTAIFFSCSDRFRDFGRTFGFTGNQNPMGSNYAGNFFNSRYLNFSY